MVGFGAVAPDHDIGQVAGIRVALECKSQVLREPLGIGLAGPATAGRSGAERLESGLGQSGDFASAAGLAHHPAEFFARFYRSRLRVEVMVGIERKDIDVAVPGIALVVVGGGIALLVG